MLADVLLLALGMALLFGGGRGLVDGASQLAAQLGISELAVGLTVVAFGTSAPELAVNTLAAVRGDADIAFGNIVGSNIANVGLVVGLSALVRPLRVESVIVSREIPMMLLATAAAVILGLDRIHGESEAYDRSDGLIFLLLFSIFLYYSISEVVGSRRSDPIAEIAAEQVHARPRTVGRAAILAAVGLGTLLLGAQLTVASAVSVARDLGVPRVVIGLTIVALGTSLPELATSLVAAWRGLTNLAVGNVVGSNIFNLLFILGTTSVIHPVEVPAKGGVEDLGSLALFSAGLLALARGRAIARVPGIALLVAYLAYVIWRFSG